MNIAEVREARLRAIQLGESMPPEQLGDLLYEVEIALEQMVACSEMHGIEATTEMMHLIVEDLSDDEREETPENLDARVERRTVLAYLKFELLDSFSKAKLPGVPLKLIKAALDRVKKGAHLREV